MGRLAAGCVVPQQETDEINERDKAVADGVEYDGALWVTETFDIDKESEEGEEGGAQADDGAHTNEALSKFNVMRFEVHVGTRWSTVLSSKEHRPVARLCL